jgi:hypothetical protein
MSNEKGKGLEIAFAFAFAIQYSHYTFVPFQQSLRDGYGHTYPIAHDIVAKLSEPSNTILVISFIRMKLAQ